MNERQKHHDSPIVLKSGFQQKLDFFKELLATRNPDLLLRKIVEFQTKQGFPSPELLKAAEKEGSELAKIFGTPEHSRISKNLFHGTGLYKYGGDKYGAIKAGERINVLAEVFREGLKPHVDPIMPGGAVENISFAPSYFYSKWYAAKYEADPRELEWQFGDPNDWFLFFMADSVRGEKTSTLAKETIERLSRAIGIQKRRHHMDVVGWISSLRSDVSAMTPFVDLYTGHSDIPGNWGAVLCFESSAISTGTYRPYVGGAHEVRRKTGVAPNLITGVGVPRIHMAEARGLADEANVRATIFSLEAADLYLSAFPMEELVRRTE